MRKEKISMIAICCLLFFPSGANGKTFDAHFEKACSEASVPKNLVVTIARHESGMNPFAVNVAGRSHQPRNREEAERIIQKARKAGKSHDIGLMQVNSFWPEKWGIEHESLLDPETNIRAGVRILAGEIARHGATWEAVGAYHSPSPERSRRYAWIIYNNARKKGGGPLAPPVNKQHIDHSPTFEHDGKHAWIIYNNGKGRKPAMSAGSGLHVEQKTGNQGILLYRRGNGDSLQRVQGRLVRF